ncbi:hypothetical protein FVR03_14560 [Pontibacter qinzhouensis]|uniref:Uncharacterized protein n=1 Tax=Pontibacter qinzhouensis TaxID=2603253 RepID=A0A5C8JKM8_9BACT|nr:hypothetical protein [Pontibacter qinzhouensis]TXK37881.1 hypothetical protein FVR03_14560 [Pontibacter qinzhouensis]
MEKRLFMLRLLVAFTLAGVLQLKLMAQNRLAPDVQEWPVGEVVLLTGDTLQGPITYYRTEDVVNVQQSDGTLRALSPVNVDYFKVQESPDAYTRFFVTYNWNLNKSYSDFRKPTFFERMNKGPVTLITRETYVHRDMSNRGFLRRGGYYDPTYASNLPNYVQQVVPVYYILFPDGEIKMLRNTKKDLERIFGKKASEVNKYAKKHRLSYEKLHGLIAIINYYNTLL